MSKNLISELSYFSLNTYENIIRKLVRASASGILNDFQDFEIALARSKKERDSFSDNERKVISEIFSDGGYPEEVLTGKYLDELEKIVVRANLFMRGSVNDKGERVNYTKELSDEITNICFEGTNYFIDYMNETIYKKSDDTIEGTLNLTEEFLECFRTFYEEFSEELGE